MLPGMLWAVSSDCTLVKCFETVYLLGYLSLNIRTVLHQYGYLVMLAC